MKISRRKSVLAVVVIIIITLSAAVAVLAAQPGSVEDPLVTRSYLDERINQLMTLITGTNPSSQPSNTNVDKDAIVKEVLASVSQQAGSAYVPVNVQNGLTVIGREGTEIILRSGTAVAYSAAANGLVDITDGSELLNGATVTANHLLLVPRGDGRGVKATSDVWLMVKGGYEVR